MGGIGTGCGVHSCVAGVAAFVESFGSPLFCKKVLPDRSVSIVDGLHKFYVQLANMVEHVQL